MGRRRSFAGVFCLTALVFAPSCLYNQSGASASLLSSFFSAPAITMPSAEREAQEIAPQPQLNAVLAHMLDAVDAMQREYYAPWVGTWPGSIDWTGAVIGTHVSAALRTLSQALAVMKGEEEKSGWKIKANLVDNYFTQVTSYYFGENAVGIRAQAYDDILWVVLGWLEAVRFVDTHTQLHFSDQDPAQDAMLKQMRSIGGRLQDILVNQTFFGNVWIPPFAHRARVFWEISTHGWETEYCGGGMVWNPRLLPYKNAITNELFVAASASMYLYFPGDDNESPFLNSGPKKQSPYGRHGSKEEKGNNQHNEEPDQQKQHSIAYPPSDPKHLQAAVDGYRWIARSNFTDAQGLIIDGFHISGYSDPKNNNTYCDQRDTAIYTYNQGVILTGARGLWQATGSRSYLEDGHIMIRNVVKATGWDLETDEPFEKLTSLTDQLPDWYGLGRLGVMEELCDASATCNQDALTFKGIFFHHLTAFCEPLPEEPPAASGQRDDHLSTARMHAESCVSYKRWIENNVRAALGTRDDKGTFGMWWTAGLLAPLPGAKDAWDEIFPFLQGGDETNAIVGSREWKKPWPTKSTDGIPRSENSEAIDYRNDGVPYDSTWRTHQDLATHIHLQTGNSHKNDHVQEEQEEGVIKDQSSPEELKKRVAAADKDPNNRGWGRTVETQSGGVAVMRAYWSILAQTE